VSRTLYTLIAIVLCSHLIWGDSLNDTTQVLSLDHLSYKQLAREFLAKPSEDERLVIAYHYLDRAVIEKDFEHIGEAYLLLAQSYDGTDIAIEYANKAIAATQGENSDLFPCKGFIELGKQYYYKGEIAEAIKYYAIADSLNNYKKTGYLNLKIKHGMGVISLRKMDLNSAKVIFFENYEFFNKISVIEEYPREYITTIMGLSQYYSRSDSIEIGLNYINEGIQKSIFLGLDEQYYTLVSWSASCLYMLGKYHASIDSIDKILDKKIYFKQTVAGAYRTTISSHLKIGKLDDAFRYLDRLEKFCETSPKSNKYLNLTYRKIGDYYNSINDAELELKYRNKQINIENIIFENTIAEVKEIEKLQTQLYVNRIEPFVFNSKYSIFLVISSFMCLGFIYFKYLSSYLYNIKLNTTNTNNNEEFRSDEFSEEIKIGLLRKLRLFEDNNGFLNSSISLTLLAKQFDSNTMYLSKIINKHKGKNFRKYINDLRIEYLIRELKFIEIYQNYTLNAISLECGFKNVRSFSKAFQNRLNCTPKAYYINLKENIIS